MPQDHEPADTGDGRTRLLDTAEVLFDERGIDGTSARSIAQAAGHRNVAAVNYHFGNRDELLRAVLRRRADVADAERGRLLDALERDGPVDPRRAMAAMLDPLVRMLDEPGGRRYLRLLNHAANHPAYYAEASTAFSRSAARGAAHLVGLVEHLPPRHRAHRAQLVLGLALYALAEQARLVDADSPPRRVLDTRSFGEDLVDMTLAALAA